MSQAERPISEFGELDPHLIASYLGSSAERRRDIPLRDNRTGEIVKRIQSWQIFLRSQITGRETTVVIQPEEREVAAIVKQDFNYVTLPEELMDESRIDFDDHASVIIRGITQVKFSPFSKSVDFIRETDEYQYCVTVTHQGRIFSNFYIKADLDNQHYIDGRDL